MDINDISYGIQYEDGQSNPVLTRIGNLNMHKSLPIQSQYAGCVVKDGVLQYYLDPNDWSKKMSGIIAPNGGVDAVTSGIAAPVDNTEISKLDGTDGDVCVHIPKFYGKSGTEGTTHWVRISETKVDDTWQEIPEMYVDAYRCTTYTENGVTKTASVVNTSTAYRGGGNRTAYDEYLTTDKFKTDLGKPRTSVSRANMRTYAKNANSELLCYEFYKWIFYWAYVIEYANFNCQLTYNAALTADGYRQGGLGSGITTFSQWVAYNGNAPVTPCGYGNSIGNGTGILDVVIPEFTYGDSNTIQAKQTLKMPRWRGFDNPFGDIWTILDGVVVKFDSDKNQNAIYTTDNNTYFDDTIANKSIAGYEVLDSNKYTSKFSLGSRGDIIPVECNGTSSTYMCDYHYTSNSTSLRLVCVGGCATSGSAAGFGCFYSDSSVAYSSLRLGFRTVKRQ